MTETRPHPILTSILVRNDGIIFVPKNGSNKEHWTYGTKQPNGYYTLHLNYKKYWVHRLVAETFIPNPDNKPFVDHIDRNPSNNNVENLRWVTKQENMNNMKTNRVVGKRRKDMSETDYNTMLHKEWRDKPENRAKINKKKSEWQKLHRAERNEYVREYRARKKGRGTSSNPL